MGGGLGETLTQIGEDFEAETGIEVSMEFQDSYENVLTNFLAALDSGEVPDLAQIDSLFAGQVIATDNYEPVENLLPDDFPVDDFLPNVTDFFEVDGVLASMPFNNSNAIMYYNRSKFEEAGLDPDDPPTTVQEVREASEVLVDDAGVVDYGITWPNHVWFPEHFFSLDGQTLVDAENGHAGDPTTINMDTQTGRDMFEWWQGMAQDGLWSNPGIEAWGEATSTFITQTSAMLITSTAFVESAIAEAESEGFEVDNAPHPSLREQRVGPVIGGASFFAPAGMPDDRREDIGEFLAFFGSVESQKAWHKGTGYYPTRETGVEELEAEGWYDEFPMYGTALEQLRNADADHPATSRMLVGPARQVQTTIQDTSVEVFEELLTVDEGIDQIITQVENEFESFYG
jgi:sn-glycerol 3-phosphate transport system substrate-binding protein